MFFILFLHNTSMGSSFKLVVVLSTSSSRSLNPQVYPSTALSWYVRFGTRAPSPSGSKRVSLFWSPVVSHFFVIYLVVKCSTLVLIFAQGFWFMARVLLVIHSIYIKVLLLTHLISYIFWGDTFSPFARVLSHFLISIRRQCSFSTFGHSIIVVLGSTSSFMAP